MHAVFSPMFNACIYLHVKRVRIFSERYSYIIMFKGTVIMHKIMFISMNILYISILPQMTLHETRGTIIIFNNRRYSCPGRPLKQKKTSVMY